MADEQKMTKEELVKKIDELQRELEDLESKRVRSMSTLVEAMLDKAEPNETELKFFKTLSRLIEMKRETLRILYLEYNE